MKGCQEEGGADGRSPGWAGHNSGRYPMGCQWAEPFGWAGHLTDELQWPVTPWWAWSIGGRGFGG